MSENIKFAKQPIVENLPKIGETNALSKPVTSNSVSTPKESKGVNNNKVITPGMFRINPSKTSREEKHVPNIVSASARTKPITVSQLHVITKKEKQTAKVYVKEIQKIYQPKVKKPKKVESHKSLATPKPRKSRLLLRWSPTGKLFDKKGKIVNSSESKSQIDCSNVERRNRTLVEAARTMLIFSRASLFLWAEAFATACFTQNLSIIHRRFNKTPYELINDRKPDISFLYVFDALCYPKNDREDIGKLGAKGDFGFFIGYSADSCTYRVYNHRTKKIIETMNVSFDELLAMAFEQTSSKLRL
nr:retrovirus-related Pol polyprotein from transposon TNT 1-94 [Tanacetum cinerariifolium]